MIQEAPQKGVRAYIAAAPKPAQPMLRTLRRIVRSNAPKATETISYRIPYYSYHGRLIYFAAFSKHVGVYLMGKSKELFAAETKPYRKTKATLQIPFGAKVPERLIARIVRARVRENEEAAGATRQSAAPRSARPRPTSPRRKAAPPRRGR
jgi:uncharacterized protein YdhG (YjbR/CyaY superfamily)